MYNSSPHALVSVGGMLRVVPNTSQDPTPSSSNSAPHPSTESATAKDSPPQLLTQKQVRELRRLCRKTANRAEYDSRPIQLRQIASIAAMGTPSSDFFEPNNRQSGNSLRAWVEFYREHGADWRDERPLPVDCIDELRRWDRALKAWARLRFEIVQSPMHARRPLHQQIFGTVQGSSPVTPHGGKGLVPKYSLVYPSREVLAETSPLVPTPPKRPYFSNADRNMGSFGASSSGLGVSPVPQSPVRRMAPIGTPVRRSANMQNVVSMGPIGTPVRVSIPMTSGVGHIGSPVRNIVPMAPNVGAIGTPVRARAIAPPGMPSVGMSVGMSPITAPGIPPSASVRGRGVTSMGIGANMGVVSTASASMKEPGVMPANMSYAARVAGGVQERSAVPAMMPSGSGLLSKLESATTCQKPEVSISRVGDTINITVPTALMSNAQVSNGGDTEVDRYVAKMDQENMYPSLLKRQSNFHAANTATSWRKPILEQVQAEYTLSAEKELAFRNAAKSLFSNSSKDATASGSGGSGNGGGRADMDWGKLRRPALRNIPVNSAAAHGQANEKVSK